MINQHVLGAVIITLLDEHNECITLNAIVFVKVNKEVQQIKVIKLLTVIWKRKNNIKK